MGIHSSDKSTKKRSGSFLGVHFDFHASQECNEIGKRTTREMIEYIIHLVKPDFMQCDCKGHLGFSSYATKVGYPAPGFIGDPLKIWRDVTRENGISLYLHYSGVLDTEAIKHHPEFAVIDEKGDIDPDVISTLGPYADQLMIPQMKELIDQYAVDGIWVDGDNWGVKPDYSEKALELFHEEAGIQNTPKCPEDPGYFELMEFTRNCYRRYLQHYVSELHKYNKDFEIASNWAYSSFMPEPVNIDVDFISGDNTPGDSVNSARLEARCLVRQGKPWDLMAWGFSYNAVDNCAITKTPIQMKQEAAIIAALGGGYQAYFQQKRDGSISRWQMNIMAEVAEFLREREKYCFKAMPVPQIGFLLSTAGYYKKLDKSFGGHGFVNQLQGVMQSLLESQNCVEIVMEHHLEGRLREYPLLIVPEWEYLEPEFVQQLLAYVEEGGNLLVIGIKTAKMFEQALGVQFTGEVEENAICYLKHNHAMYAIKSARQNFSLQEGVKAIGKIYKENDDIGPTETAASIRNYGKGKIAAMYFEFGENYIHGATSTARKFINSLVRELFPEPVVEISGSSYVDVCLMRKNDKIHINLINTAGPHSDNKTVIFDEIPPIGPLELKIRLPETIRKIVLEPDGKDISFKYEDGIAYCKLEKLEIHSVIVIET